MYFDYALKELRQGNEVYNKNCCSLNSKNIVYLKLQFPDKDSFNTEPYIMMVIGSCVKGDWIFKRFPWTPNQLDLLSSTWEIKK